MRYARQNKILELIETHEIETPEKLSALLKESGFDVTQNADEEGILLKDVVSRKKQLVPALMETV